MISFNCHAVPQEGLGRTRFLCWVWRGWFCVFLCSLCVVNCWRCLLVYIAQLYSGLSWELSLTLFSCYLSPKELLDQQVNSKIVQVTYWYKVSIFILLCDLDFHPLMLVNLPVNIRPHGGFFRAFWWGSRKCHLVWCMFNMSFWDANHEPARLLLHDVFLNFQAILNLCICFFFLIIFLRTLEWMIPHIIRVHNSKSQWTLSMARHSSLNQAIHV